MIMFEGRFDAMVAATLENLTELKTNTSHAAEQLRRKPGRPRRSGVLQDDFLNSLESTYRDITGERGGAGAGPFSRFAVKFLAALRHTVAEQTVIKRFRAIRKTNIGWG
jgi:hypothetical protein